MNINVIADLNPFPRFHLFMIFHEKGNRAESIDSGLFQSIQMNLLIIFFYYFSKNLCYFLNFLKMRLIQFQTC